jgi:hypothetical protein
MRGFECRKFWFYAFVSIAAINARPATGESPKSPREVVERYCLFDAQGANFDSKNPYSKAIGKLLINEDEAGYDSSVVILSYRVGNATLEKGAASVMVIYEDLGTLSGGHLEQNKEAESVVFHLSRIRNSWKIDGLRILPHISKTWVLSELGKGQIVGRSSSSDLVRELNK